MRQMKPLSSLLYIKYNIKKFIPQLIATSFGVFLVYFLCVLGGGVRTSALMHTFKTYEKLSAISIYTSSKSDMTFFKNIKENNNVRKVIHSSIIRDITTKGLISDTGSPVFFTSTKDTKYLMDLFDFKLIKGALPRSPYELLVSKYFARGQNLHIGSFYGSEINKKYRLDGKYKICGIYDGSHTITFGHSQKFYTDKYGYTGYIIIPKRDKLDNINNLLNNYRNMINIDTIDEERRGVDGFLSTINMFLIIILLVTVFVITFAISNINYMYLYDRTGEFSILNAMGYSKAKITNSLSKELAMIIFLGYVAGTLLGMTGGFIFCSAYCAPKGIVIPTVSPWYLLITLTVPLLVSLLCAIPTMKYIKRMNTLEVLEGRA